jgi:hypothetical protein
LGLKKTRVFANPEYNIVKKKRAKFIATVSVIGVKNTVVEDNKNPAVFSCVLFLPTCFTNLRFIGVLIHKIVTGVLLVIFQIC